MGKIFQVSYQPVKVEPVGGKLWKQVASATYFTCAIDEEGAACCWGKAATLREQRRSSLIATVQPRTAWLPRRACLRTLPKPLSFSMVKTECHLQYMLQVQA